MGWQLCRRVSRYKTGGETASKSEVAVPFTSLALQEHFLLWCEAHSYLQEHFLPCFKV